MQERTQFEDTLAVTGTLHYRERIMLSPGSSVRLSIHPITEGAAPALVDTTWATDEQIPIAFSLDVLGANVDTTVAYGLSARLISAEGRMRWSTPQPIPVLTRGAPREVGEVILHADDPSPETALTEPWLRARERGVTFRGLGHDPVWTMDLFGSRHDPKRLDLEIGDREEDLTFDELQQDTDGEGNLRYRATHEDRSVEVTVEDRQCADSITGEVFEAVVTVRLDDQELTGCGRSLS